MRCISEQSTPKRSSVAKHEVRHLVVPDGTDRQAVQPELGKVEDCAAGRTGNGETDFVDELDIAAGRDPVYRPAENIGECTIRITDTSCAMHLNLPY